MKKAFYMYESLYSFIGAAIISLIFWIYSKEYMISIIVPTILCLILFSIIWFLLIELDVEKQIKPEFKIIKISDNKGDVIFKTNVKNFLIVGSVLALYKSENDFERLYGVVIINNIQENCVQGTVKYINTEDGIDANKENLVIKAAASIEDLKTFFL